MKCFLYGLALFLQVVLSLLVLVPIGLAKLLGVGVFMTCRAVKRAKIVLFGGRPQ